MIYSYVFPKIRAAFEKIPVFVQHFFVTNSNENGSILLQLVYK